MHESFNYCKTYFILLPACYPGPRSDHDTRPMDKQSIRSYPGMDRESVRSGRRSRRDDDSSSAYSDGARKYKRFVFSVLF